LDKPKASLGVSSIPFYQLRHKSGPRHLKRRTSVPTALKKIRSAPHHLVAARCGKGIKAMRQTTLLKLFVGEFVILLSGTRPMDACGGALSVGNRQWAIVAGSIGALISIRNTRRRSFRRSADRLR
jgi:hypothetical protein